MSPEANNISEKKPDVLNALPFFILWIAFLTDSLFINLRMPSYDRVVNAQVLLVPLKLLI